MEHKRSFIKIYAYQPYLVRSLREDNAIAKANIMYNAGYHRKTTKSRMKFVRTNMTWESNVSIVDPMSTKLK